MVAVTPILDDAPVPRLVWAPGTGTILDRRRLTERDVACLPVIEPATAEMAA